MVAELILFSVSGSSLGIGLFLNVEFNVIS